jgi:hypothetical protein
LNLDVLLAGLSSMSSFFVLALLANGRSSVVTYWTFNDAEGVLSFCNGNYCFYNRVSVKVDFMRFCVLETTSMKAAICRNSVPCDVIEICRCFQGASCLDLAVFFLLILLRNHEEGGGSNPIRNAGKLL